MKPAKNISPSRLNRLGEEKSPYLLQHAHQPVNWYPWGEDAFTKARLENKPVLLSVGYSACHWCHVMAHESFENEKIAELMNQYFVSVKVDREEYPDVDHFYQSFVQLSSGRGGWPLTVFLTPDKVPFYGGTYFPAISRYGLMSFPDLLNRIHDIYQHDHPKVLQNAAGIRRYFQESHLSQGRNELPVARQVLDNFYHYLQKSFDRLHGGFTSAPKFPQVSDMEFLFNYYHHTGELPAREMVLFTLRKMANGGIYDQIGGGFHRYSTDEKWLVPHFEKMLYDNALLIGIYANAFRLTGDEFYRQIARDTADFVLRELSDPAGGFYSSLDADSEGQEGQFYLWSYAEMKQQLNGESRELFCNYYDITPDGNFEGKNILHVNQPIERPSENSNADSYKIQQQLEECRQKLLLIREQRKRPALDNKILTDWNGLMISALWNVFQITGNVRYRAAAEKALKFLLQNYLTDQGLLSHFVRSNSNRITGYIDDYAFLIQALLTGFETIHNTDYLRQALHLTEYSLSHFWDATGGGFYFTDQKSQNIIVRPKHLVDSATPTGNHIMCLNLLKLHYLTANPDYLSRAEKIFQLNKSDLENRGAAVTSLMQALSFYHFSPLEITFLEKEPQPKPSFSEIWQQIYLPNKLLVKINPVQGSDLLNPALFQNRLPAGRSAISICHRSTCFLPLFDADQFFAILKELNLNVH